PRQNGNLDRDVTFRFRGRASSGIVRRTAGRPGRFAPIRSDAGVAQMLRKFGVVFGGGVAIVLGIGSAGADGKNPAIKEIMKAVGGTKAEKKKDGLCSKCVTAGKGENWDDAQKFGKQLKECAAALPSNKCPKGEKESWEKLTKKYAEQAAAVAKAADDKD